jgi:acetyl/propionyl-CoA carboxylase alpha subunit
VTRWVEPVGGSLRIDTHCYGGYTVPPCYDSLLAKLIAHGRDRDHAMSELASESSTQRPREAASERSEARRSATRTATRSPTRS